MQFAQLVAEKLKGEGANLIAQQSNNEDAYRYAVCTVRNRLENGWNESDVLTPYYAPNRSTDLHSVLTAYNILNRLDGFDCGDVYFMYSNEDLVYLGIPQSKVIHTFQGTVLGLNYVNRDN